MVGREGVLYLGGLLFAWLYVRGAFNGGASGCGGAVWYCVSFTLDDQKQMKSKTVKMRPIALSRWFFQDIASAERSRANME